MDDMTTNKNALYFALICSTEGLIQQVLEISHPSLFNISQNQNLLSVINPGSQDKMMLFIQQILEESHALGWEIIFDLSGENYTLQLFGFLSANDVLILAAPNLLLAESLRKKILSDHSAKTTKWEIFLRDDFQPKPGQYTDQQSVEDISRLNNEIIVLQRELVKKQSQLEKLNAAIQAYSESLEELVAQRTQELRISEAKFRGIFESSSLGIAIMQFNGTIVAANQALVDIIGFDIDNIIDHPIYQFLIGKGDQEYKKYIRDLENSPDDSYQLEEEIIRGDGSHRWIEINLFLIQPGDDSRFLAVTIIEDVTEKKASQQALLRAEKLSTVGKIAASLAHEINNPLQAVMGNIGLARETLDEGSHSLKLLEIASSELKRVSQIVADLRDASRKPTNKEKNLAVIDEIIQKVIDLTRKKCEERKINLTYQPQKTAPVLINRDQISQVVLNLVLNAIDAMPEGGNLHIYTNMRVESEGVSVFIEDDGAGLSVESRAHLFEPFYSTKQEGMGLGLYVSQEILKAHKGNLKVIDNQKKGTLFEMWLPTAESDQVKTK